MLLPCPHCGPRSVAEFTFERPLEAITAPDAPMETLVHNLFTRDNPKGPSRELWRHAYGCRSWVVMTRDTFTHAVTDAAPASSLNGGAA
jgi:sarcosine oxidase subunit delta